MTIRRLSIALALSALCILRAQDEPNPKTLLPQRTLDAIADEVSGTLAYQHILELAGYEHDRLAIEYRTIYRESAYIEKMAKQYGLEDFHIERFKMPGKTWDGERGELWLLGKDGAKRLVMSYRDVAASLARGSRPADVTAELVWVGSGAEARDYDGKSVAGKVVLATGPLASVHNLAVREFGAAGVISFANETGRPIDRPDQIAWSSVGRAVEGKKTTFGIVLSHRLGTELARRLEQHETLNVHVIVETAEYDADMQVPTCVIRGTSESGQEVAVTGHLFEGIAKQGALDDASGSATALEIARAWKKLIDDGILPRPKRTIRFLWVPEIQGTTAYLERYPEEARRMVAAISMDMVGEDVTKNHNSLHLTRTPYSLNHFINEVTQQFFEYVGDSNREKIHNRRIGYRFLSPIVDPQGTLDPFYYNVEKHYGASDHSAFLRFGVPAILLNNWPDAGYHTSEDRAFNADPTQLKRVALIGIATLHTIANAAGQSALRIAEVTAGYAAQRTGVQFGLALQTIGEGGSYADAKNLVHQAYVRESEAIRSAQVLAGNSDTKAKIDGMAKTFAEAGEMADMTRLNQYAAALGADLTQRRNADEQRAASLVPVRQKPTPRAPGGLGSGAQGDPLEASRRQYDEMEMRGFADGARTLLDIRDALSAEYGPRDAGKVIAFFESLAATGEFRLTPAR
jgi:aminopeptidase YwaD